jgi:hypothetical protein
MAASNRGLVFIGEDLTNFRAFRSEALDGDGRAYLWIRDIDQDGGDEYVFAGDPSFVLDGGGDPLFGLLSGCADFALGNILDDPVEEIFCRSGNTISVWYFDGQFLWEYSLTGRRIRGCTVDDSDGDEALEFGCETNDNWLLIDLGNNDPVQELGDNPQEDATIETTEAWEAETRALLTGEQTVDLDGDGRANETLFWNGGALNLIGSDGATMGSASIPGEIYSVVVGDLNGDGVPEVFAGGVGEVYVIGNDGTILSTVNANPGSLDRTGRVTITAANANGLDDSAAETTMAAVETELGRVERCYASQMGSDQFVRVGTMFFELSVDGGRVSSARRIHSSIANSELESCVSGALERIRFSGGSGTVSVRLGFDFVDQ